MDKDKDHVERYLRGAKREKSLEERKDLKQRSRARKQNRKGGARRVQHDWEREGEEALERERIPRAPRYRPPIRTQLVQGPGAPTPEELETMQAALVLGLDPGRARLLLDGRECSATLEGSIARVQQSAIAVGDFVAVEELAGGNLRVRAVHPRRSSISRPDPQNPARERVQVANVERGVVVVSARQPDFKPRLIDRYLVALAYGGVEPLVAVSKADLLGADRAEVTSMLDDHRAAGVTCLLCSATSGEGLGQLRAQLAGRTSVFVGQSGVGKSSLLNALKPELSLTTGEVRTSDGKGRHTTTGSTLHDLGDETYVIDTPGVRALGLTGIDRRSLGTYFPEFGRVERCRFADCLHDSEPGCAVSTAVEAGGIPRRRHATYLRILESLKG